MHLFLYCLHCWRVIRFGQIRYMPFAGCDGKYLFLDLAVSILSRCLYGLPLYIHPAGKLSHQTGVDWLITGSAFLCPVICLTPSLADPAQNWVAPVRTRV